MKNSLIAFSSITYALKAQKHLEQRGIFCDIVKTPKSVNGCGCGHSLKVKDNELSRAFLSLEKEKIPMIGTYTNGQVSGSDLS